MINAENEVFKAVDSMREDIINFVQGLVQVRSLPGEEQAVQELIATKLQELGLEVVTLPVKREDIEHHPAFCDDGFPYEKRSSVVGTWKGKANGKTSTSVDCFTLILNGHVDVVSPGNESAWSDSPWSGKVVDGRIYGRGSLDMKAGLSAGIFSVQALQVLGYQPLKDVIIESVSGEETGGCGTLTTIVNGYYADAAIILEPTNFKICPVQSGALSFRLKVSGRAIHACMKNRGVSAIEKFYTLFNAVSELEKQRHLNYDNPLYEDPMNVAPINFGTLKSGDWPSTVPDELVAEGRYGVLPGEPVTEAKKIFEEAIARAARVDEWLRDHQPVVEWFEGQFESGQTNMEDPIIKQLSACHKSVFGRRPAIAGVTYGSDLRLFTNHAKIPAVLYGPGDVTNAHVVDESISIEDIISATKIIALTIYEWCGAVKN